MNKKTVLIAFLALALGIGGTAAYFYFHSLYVAHTAPPVPPAASAPAQPAAAQQSAPASQAAPATQAQNSGVIPPANANNNAAAGTLADNQLVLANISYGAAIDAVRQSYGEPYEIDHEHERQFNGSATVYEYKDTFDLYVVNGIVQRIQRFIQRIHFSVVKVHGFRYFRQAVFGGLYLIYDLLQFFFVIHLLPLFIRHPHHGGIDPDYGLYYFPYTTFRCQMITPSR